MGAPVIKRSNLRRKTVDLDIAARPSRIRRPAHVVKTVQLSRDPWWETREWEIRLAIAGILFFALAITALVVDIGEFFAS
jgi:hypothetical protein